MPDKAKWNQSEFITFLLLHASHADLEFTDDEREAIMKNVTEQTFEEIYATYEEMGDYEILQTIIDYKGLYYPTVERKNELLNLVQEQFKADGVYSTLEKNLIIFLEKLI